MSRTLRNLVTLSCVLMAGHAAAEDLDTRVYLTPSVNYTHTDTRNWGLDDGFGFGLGVGKAVSESINVELNGAYSTQSLKTGSGTGDLQNTSLSVDGLYFFDRNANFAPYALAGVGATHGRATGISETNFMGDLGLGVMTWMKDIAVRGDVRYRYIDGRSNIATANDWIATVGLVIPLGDKPAAPMPAPAPAPAPAPYVAPAPAPEPAPAPAPEVVRPAAHTKIILEGTNFDFNKASLRPAGKLKLDENVKTLTQYSDINVEITGHTDSIGTEKYNQKLSEKRAETVKNYMESKGIAASRMTTKGYGESKPIASNKTAAGRAENRRVEIEILN